LPAFIFYLAGTSAACSAMALLPELSLIPAILWGTLLILAGLHLELRKILIIYLINISLLFTMGGASNFLVYLTFFAIPAIVMTMLLFYRMNYYQIQHRGVIAAVLGVSLFLVFSYFSSGGVGITEMEAELNRSAEESIRVYEETGIFDIYEQMGISQADFEAALKQTTATFARHLPAIFYDQAIIAVFFILFFASYISRKRNIERLKKKSFREEIMPWQLVWIAIAGMGLWIWGRDELNYVYYIGSNILCIIVPIAIYYGLSSIIYKMAEQKRSTRMFMIIGLILLTMVFPLSAIIFLSIIGLFDSLVDFRRLRTGQEE